MEWVDPWQLQYLKTLMHGHGGSSSSSAGSYLADPTSPIPSHCTVIILLKKCPSASIVVTSTLRVNWYIYQITVHPSHCWWTAITHCSRRKLCAQITWQIAVGVFFVFFFTNMIHQKLVLNGITRSEKCYQTLTSTKNTSELTVWHNLVA